jgi:hypothetical protein
MVHLKQDIIHRTIMVYAIQARIQGNHGGHIKVVGIRTTPVGAPTQ